MARMALTLPEVLKCEDVERSNSSSLPRLSGVNETMRRCRETAKFCCVLGT